MEKKRGNAGFTLVELLVVVAIIAVLAAIAIPTFGGAKKKAEITADDANIRSALSIYQMARMTDGVALDGSDELTFAKRTKKSVYYMAPDGSFTTEPANALTLMQKHDNCPIHDGFNHEKGYYIAIIHGEDNQWSLESVAPSDAN